MIPLVKTFLPPREVLIPKIEEVLYSGYISQGESVEVFEKQLGDYLGNKYCVTVNSGSSALHIALILAGVKQGDEVITTPLTAEPTNTVINQTGAKIVWADIDISTGNICPIDVEAKITSKTKAIMVVDYAGIPVDVSSFQRIEKDYGIPIIQDSAHAFGASFAGKKLGNHFSYTTFSFQAIKHMTTIDGGLIVLNNKEEYEEAKLIRWFGLNKKLPRKKNDIYLQGYKYHMNNINAVVGSVQMETIDDLITSYINNGKYFDRELKNVSGVTLMEYYPDSDPSYWLYTLKVKNKDKFISNLNVAGIGASDLHKRNDTNTLFYNSRASLPNVDRFETEWVHIPCGWWLSDDDRCLIVDTIKKGW